MPEFACDVLTNSEKLLHVLTGMWLPIAGVLERADGIGEAFRGWEGVSRFREWACMVRAGLPPKPGKKENEMTGAG